MGTYLSTPVTEKHVEYGESFEYIHDTTSSNSSDNDPSTTTTTTTSTTKKAIPYIHWGVVEMQGWRKSMEDSHVTQTNVVLLPTTNRNSTTTTTTSSNNHTMDTNENTVTNTSSNSNSPSVAVVKDDIDPTGAITTTTTTPSNTSTTASVITVEDHHHPHNDNHQNNDNHLPSNMTNDDSTTPLLGSETTSSSSSQWVTHVFGVFDGHGGAEVARFVALYIVSVLQRQLSELFQSSLLSENTVSSSLSLSSSTSSQEQLQLYRQHIGTALIQTFHALDRMIDDPTRRDEILKLKTTLLVPNTSTTSSTSTNMVTSKSSLPPRPEQRIAVYIPPPKPMIVSSSQPTPHVPTASVVVPTTTSTSTVPPVQSLQSSTPPSQVPPSQIQSTLSTTNTTTSDTTQNVMIVVDQPPINATPSESSSEEDDQSKKDHMDSLTETTAKSTIEPTTSLTVTTDENDDSDDTDSLDHPMDGTEEACAFDQDMMLDDNDNDDAIDQDNFDEILVNAMMTTATTSDNDDNNDMVILPNNTNSNADDHTTRSSTDMEMTNAIEVIAMDSNQSSVDNHSTTTTPTPTTSTTSVSGKVSGMLQRLLKLSGPAGQVILGTTPTASNNNNNKNPKNNNLSNSTMNNNNNSATQSSSPSSGTTVMNIQNNNNNPSGMISSPPSVVRNGQLMCNLKDHPIHAGATAIVAVLHGYTLTVANAGDSRAVLCRGYDPKTNPSTSSTSNFNTHVVVPLSTDHKPMQSTELFRIIHAGGFVNTFGRINGNLNLSRSIGDLKYKQVHHLSPAQQMITAEPDIVQLELNDTDEFIIIGCDGIWDCLSNEKAVEFVATRIHDYTPTEIGTMMLNFIISPDPRQTQGIGGDNMTILIIDLQPKSRRWYRSRSIQHSTTMSENIGNSIHSSNNNASTSGVGHVLVTSSTK